MFAGGLSATGNSNVVDIFNASNGQWSSGTLSQARADLAATTVGTLALFAGGATTSTQSNVVDIYNASTDAWSTATLSQARFNLAATTVGTQAIFAGGYGGGGYSNVVDIFNASSGQWSTTTLSLKSFGLAATTVGTQALFAGGYGGGYSSIVNIFTLPPEVTLTTPSSPSTGNTTIDYSLIGQNGASNPASILVQYSVNGGPWLPATEAAGGSGTSNLTSSPSGTAHTFVWDTAHDLGGTTNPSVQIQITPYDVNGFGVTVPSGNFPVFNSGGFNALSIEFTDAKDDTVQLIQDGLTININGTMTGSATNMTSVSVMGGTGNNLLDASQMEMPVTLNGGAGSGPDTLLGGAGDDTLYYSGTGSTFDGGGGVDNTLVYPANPGDVIAFGVSGLIVNGVSKNPGSVSQIEYFLVSGSPASVNNSQPPQTSWPLSGPAYFTSTSVTGAGDGVNTIFSGYFQDLYATAYPGVSISWGDGTTLPAQYVVYDSFNDQWETEGSDVLPYGTYAVTVTVADPAGAATSSTTIYTGGVELSGGDLFNGPITDDSQPLDSGVSSDIISEVDDTVFTLHPDGSLWDLWAVTAGSPAELATDVQSMPRLSADGWLYALSDGSLLATNGGTPEQIAGNVQSFALDSNGNVYALEDGSLNELPGGVGSGNSWANLTNQAEQSAGIQSMVLDPSNTSVDVVFTNGDAWQYTGSAWTAVPPSLAMQTAGSVTAGQPTPVTVSILDPSGDPITDYTGTIHFSSSDVTAGLPADYTFTAADAGTHLFMVTFDKAGTPTLTASDTTDTSLSATSRLTVEPAAPASLQFAIVPQAMPVAGSMMVQEGATAGVPIGITITALDPYGNVATGYNGTVSLSSSDSTATLPASVKLSNGTTTFSALFKVAGSATVQALDKNTQVTQDGTTTSLEGTSAPITVAPAALNHLAITAPSRASVGQNFAVIVTAEDKYDNAIPGYTGLVELGGSSGALGLPASYQFVATDSGSHSFTAAVSAQGALSVTATDTADSLPVASANIEGTAPVVPQAGASLAGPAGYGAPAFISSSAVLPYTITFVNEPASAAAAQVVTVSEQLGPGLDWQSFEWNSLGFGSDSVQVPAGMSSFSTEIDARATVGLFVDVHADFDPNSGLVTVTFTSIDPTTLTVPANSLTGFLPPNTSSGAGQGFVSFTVSPRRTEAIETVITAQASVIFDSNAPVVTPLFSNTVDSGAPTSSVAPLPAQSAPQFTVSWSGTDEVDGSGIAFFTIYVSDDGGPFMPFLTNTTETSAVYNGATGQTYSFYSVATDNIGNTQPTPAAAQATTTVVAPATSTMVTSSADPSTVGESVTFQATVTGPSGLATPIGSVQFEIDGSPFGSPVTLENGVATSSAITTLTTGMHTVTATFSSANQYAPSTGTLAGGQTVNQATAVTYTIFTSSATPLNVSQFAGGPVEVGVKFESSEPGYIQGIRFYKGPSNTGTHVGYLWSATGALLESAIFTNETDSGWQQVSFPDPVAITASTPYVASYLSPTGYVAYTANGFGSAVTNGPLTAPRSSTQTPNGVYLLGTTGAFPNSTHQTGNYWVDVAFVAALHTTPTSEAAGVSPTAPDITATFSSAVQSGTISFTVQGPGNSIVTGSSSYNSATDTSSWAPSSPLASATTYWATVNATGSGMTGPYSWSFTTAASTAIDTIFTSLQTPVNTSQNAGTALEVGVEFESSQPGYIQGIRFYKGTSNTGTHVGYLWSASNQTLLESATFTNETASGWQQVSFPDPVAITANTPYVASYLSPTGYVAYTPNGFGSAVTNAPLSAPHSSAQSPNGVYLLGTSGLYPNSTHQTGNYWVDVEFTPSASGGSVTPAAGHPNALSIGSETDATPALGSAGGKITSGSSAVSENNESRDIAALDTVLADWSASDSNVNRVARILKRMGLNRRQARKVIAMIEDTRPKTRPAQANLARDERVIAFAVDLAAK